MRMLMGGCWKKNVERLAPFLKNNNLTPHEIVDK